MVARTKTPWQTALNRADEWFSRLVRLSNASQQLKVLCATCPNVLPIKSIDAGHFVDRDVWETRFDEVNVQPQCPSCNRGFMAKRSGQGKAFTRFIWRVYGTEELGRLLEIDARRNSPGVKPSEEELRAIAKRSREECHERCRELGIKLSAIW